MDFSILNSEQQEFKPSKFQSRQEQRGELRGQRGTSSRRNSQSKASPTEFWWHPKWCPSVGAACVCFWPRTSPSTLCPRLLHPWTAADEKVVRKLFSTLSDHVHLRKRPFFFFNSRTSTLSLVCFVMGCVGNFFSIHLLYLHHHQLANRQANASLQQLTHIWAEARWPHFTGSILFSCLYKRYSTFSSLFQTNTYFCSVHPGINNVLLLTHFFILKDCDLQRYFHHNCQCFLKPSLRK